MLIYPPKNNDKAWHRENYFLVDRNRDGKIDQIILFGSKKNNHYDVLEELLDRDLDGEFETRYIQDKKSGTSKYIEIKNRIKSVFIVK